MATDAVSKHIESSQSTEVQNPLEQLVDDPENEHINTETSSSVVQSEQTGGKIDSKSSNGNKTQIADTALRDSQGARPKVKAEEKGDEGMAVLNHDLLPVTDSCLDNLSKGLLQALLPHFEKHEGSLTELTRNQELLIETLQQENQKFTENKMVSELTKMMVEAKQYQSKLTGIKKEMTSLHEKSTKLKKRALKLQQQKMKENLQKEQQREREIEEDRRLTAKRAAAPGLKTPPHR